MKLGFDHFDEVPTIPTPTVAEMLAGLSAAKRSSILTAFTNKITVKRFKYEVDASIPNSVVDALYRAIDRVEDSCTELVRGERLITPEERDPVSGEITTPAVYNTPPNTITQLKTAIAAEFAADFTTIQSNAIVTNIVKYSKHDGTGTDAYYAAERIK